MTVPGVEDARLEDPQNSPRWARIATHGGPLMQNVVSGICRDLLAGAMLKLDEGERDIVLHVHDDVNCEASEHDAEFVCSDLDEAMNFVPTWATGFPVVSQAKVMRRYGG